jgi:hypothetical protein
MAELKVAGRRVCYSRHREFDAACVAAQEARLRVYGEFA